MTKSQPVTLAEEEALSAGVRYIQAKNAEIEQCRRDSLNRARVDELNAAKLKALDELEVALALLNIEYQTNSERMRDAEQVYEKLNEFEREHDYDQTKEQTIEFLFKLGVKLERPP